MRESRVRGETTQGGRLDADNAITINGQNILGFDVEPEDNDGRLRGAINAVSDVTGVVAEMVDGQLTLIAPDGRNITVSTSSQAAAQRTGLPLIIHARDADQDMADILTSEYRNAPYSCVMHCFSSSAELARAALDLGFYLSMSGIAAFPKSQDLRDIFAAAPIDRILVETDSPYLAPPPYRGKRNEPAYSMHTAAKGAEVFGLDIDAFARQLEENFDRLFTKARIA